MSIARDKIIALRDTAERLMLGTPGERWLRGCVVELCNILVGIDQQHAELDISGARFPAPVRHVATPTPPLAPPPSPIPPHVGKPGAPAPAGTVLRPGMSIGEMQAVAAQRKQGLRAVPAAAPPAAPVPEPPAVDPAAPDPAGDFEARLASLATEGEALAAGGENAAAGEQEGA